MDRKTYDVLQSAGGYEELEQMMKRGRQMHDQAVFDLFARLVSRAVHFVKESFRIPIQKQDAGAPYQGVFVKQSSRHPA